MKREFTFSVFLLVLLGGRCFGQSTDSTASFKISGYVDAYYAYYTDSVGVNNYQKFPDISPRNNAFGLNTLQFTGQYSAQKIRAIATLHFGDIATSAWSPSFNFIQEANAGVRLSKKVWLDAGLFKTHIGTEALLPKDNIVSSLSVITFYEPWFQAGFKLTYSPNDNLTLCLHVLNGYNIFLENNSKKSAGISLSYLLGKKGSIGYYNLVGNEAPDSIHVNKMRFLNNLVFNYEFSKKFKMLAGVDCILQKNSGITDTTKTAFVYSGILTFRYQMSEKSACYFRGETFNDASGFLTGTITDAQNKTTGFINTGETIGVEYKVTDNSYIRLEGRQIQMDKNQQIFRTNGTNTNIRTELMIHTGIWF